MERKKAPAAASVGKPKVCLASQYTCNTGSVESRKYSITFISSTYVNSEETEIYQCFF